MDLLIFISLICKEPKLVPSKGWTKYDLYQLEIAKPGCKRYFGPRSCLVEFKKTGVRDYEAKCKNS